MSHLGLTAHRITVGYGATTVLHKATLTIAPGRRIAILGANGSGKTTLLRVLSGALRPAEGTVTVGGEVVRYDRAGLTRHRQQVQLVLQDPDDQLFSADVARDVSFGPTNLGLARTEVVARVEEALDVLGISDLAARPTHQLSFGQRKRVAIAGALAMRPCLLLLDEPTAGLDPYGVDELFAALTRLEAMSTTAVLATHDVDLALAWADDVAVVCGRRVEQGEAHDILADDGLLARSRLRAPWVLDLLHRLGRPTTTRPRDARDVVAILGTIEEERDPPHRVARDASG